MHEPTFESKDAFTVLGLPYHGSNEDGQIPALWDVFGDREEEFQSLATAAECYGVCTSVDAEDGTIEYVAGVPADEDATIPEGMVAVDLPAAEYAVFTTTLADLGGDIDAFYEEWLPNAACERADGAEFERYDSGFDGSQDAELEYFVPVTRAE